ncbi:hypothetical protein NZK32_12065 [Cyanobium sp. FGCU-52]|nr:hypothetical protein [Cyanobium sp. FGCU52]
MSDATDPTPLEELTTAPIRQVLDAMEAAELTPEDALQLSLVLLNFVEEVHLDNLEELLEQEQADGVSIAVWAADSARLKTARELLEEVLGDDDDEEAIDGGEGDEVSDEG